MGAQKAATTFIYKSLQKDIYYSSPFQKELHVFDTYYLENEYKINFKKNLINKIVNSKDKLDTDYRLLAFMNDPTNYYNYFDDLIPNKQHSFSSDISPTYSLLSEKHLHNIKENFKKKGINTKVFFNIREPITRLNSAIKMRRRRKKSTLYNLYTELTKDSIISRLAKSKLEIGRVNYMQIHKNITNVFDKHEYVINLYETMFSDSSLKKLSYFLFNDRKTYIENRKINTSKNFAFNTPYKINTIESLLEFYGEHYEFCESLFPGSKTLWKQNAINLLGKN